MNSNQNILSELKIISPAVANLPKTNPFSVPLDYFEKNISNIINHIKENQVNNENKSLNHISSIEKNKPAFEVPNDYFETFEIKLMNKIRTAQSLDDELSEIAPGLISLRNNNPFTVPNDYFDSSVIGLPGRKNRLAKVFQMKNMLRYAAAAFIIGFMGFLYLFIKVDNSAPLVASSLNNQQTEELSLNEMLVYLEQMDAVDHDNDLALSDGDESNLLVDLNKETIKELLNGIPDKGIQEFIENEGIIIEKTSN
jgi:hypothetical protein